MDEFPTRPPEATSIEDALPPDWWEMHRAKWIGGVVLVLVAIVAWTIFSYNQRKRELEARTALSAAASVEQLQEVSAKYTGTPEAASAAFLRGIALMESEKWDEAFEAFGAFEKTYPEHALTGGAVAAQAVIREMQGKFEEAKSLYQRVGTSYQNSYAAPFAMIGEARMYEQMGSPEDARKMLTEIVTRMPGSVFAGEAAALLERPVR